LKLKKKEIEKTVKATGKKTEKTQGNVYNRERGQTDVYDDRTSNGQTQKERIRHKEKQAHIQREKEK